MESNKLIIPGFAHIDGESFSLVVEMNEKNVASLKGLPNLAKEVQEVASVIFERLAEEVSKEELQKGKVLLEGERVYFSSSQEDSREISNYPLRGRAFESQSLLHSGIGLNLLKNKSISGAFLMIMKLTQENEFVSLPSLGTSRVLNPIKLFPKRSSMRNSREEMPFIERPTSKREDPVSIGTRAVSKEQPREDESEIYLEEVISPQKSKEVFQPTFESSKGASWYNALPKGQKSRFSHYVRQFDGVYPESISDAQIHSFQEVAKHFSSSK